MRPSLVSSLVALAACSASEPPRDASPEPEGESDPNPVANVDLDWSMQRIGDELHIEYTVTNRRDHAIQVFDHLLDYDQAPYGSERIIVHDAEYASTVAFTHGFVHHVATDKLLGAPPDPAMRRLDAGSSIRGAAVVPIPLEAWLNYYFIKPLELGITHGILEVAVYDCFKPPCRAETLLGERRRLPEGAVSWIPLPPTPEWYQYDQSMQRIMRNNAARERARNKGQ